MTDRTPRRDRRRRVARAAALALLLAGAPQAAAAAEADPAPPTAFQPDAVPPQTEEGPQFTVPLSEPSRPKEWFLAIYSGTTLGTYYYIASAICRTLEATFESHHVRCVPLRSAGVGGNVRLMRDGRAQAIIVQSNTNHMAATGEQPIPGARSAMSLHDEIGVLVTRPDSGIEAFPDIRGKRINLGEEGSATRQMWSRMFAIHDMGPADLGAAYEGAQDSNVLALCDGAIDAFASWIGHPSELIERAVEACDARAVGLWTPQVARMVEDTAYLFEQELPAGSYETQPRAVRSYGFKASLVVHEEVPDHIVYNVVKTLVEEIAFFRGEHPALAGARARDFFAEGNSLPFHRGAARYYRERGWLPESVEEARAGAVDAGAAEVDDTDG